MVHIKYVIKRDANYRIEEVEDDKAEELKEKGANVFDSKKEANKWIWEKLKEMKKEEETVFDRLRKRMEEKE